VTDGPLGRQLLPLHQQDHGGAAVLAVDRGGRSLIVGEGGFESFENRVWVVLRQELPVLIELPLEPAPRLFPTRPLLGDLPGGLLACPLLPGLPVLSLQP
jgi:hypothetical protein